jgi:HSP20 family molecular chaperone IbpA
LEYTLTLCVPGLAPEAIEITTESDQLNITLKPSTQNEGPQAQWFHEGVERPIEGVERPIGGQSFKLPTDADSEIISAKLDRGILKITIPRIQKAPPRVIPVDASGYGDH